ncbi:acyl-CoA N-acyltransferase [Wolfiporia cocos MD-104 SS10]|uniref:Acyl-CoA N-acyltransferase n=1 Tax=Wolfiporia cocos (strain MD-104) TaxID=742152 RepID=A0A2H3IZQ1_WOLCO|nr:acyl-CoA N-acyltransferase [Wolfiporia cocos MD-104 SS10]
MRCNENTAIVDRDVVLVPYKNEHVVKYHEWMSSPELLELTASEPLTLEEEYEMQKKWQIDEDKLTFIILATHDPDGKAIADAEAELDLTTLPMVGDVNLFLKGSKEDDDFEAEVEIMIAEPAYRRRGLARAALQLMLSFATSPDLPKPLPVPKDKLVVRIGEKNTPSVRLFEKLGFELTKRVEIFEEVEMRYRGQSQNLFWREGTRRQL